MRMFSVRFASLVLLCPIILATGCSDSGNNTSTPAPAITLSPGTQQTIDQGQTVHITATVANDVNSAGVSWSLSGSGSLTSSSTTGVTYNAPTSGVTSATTATITATSVAKSSVTATQTVVVNPAPSISSSAVTLTAATMNTAYSANLATALSASGGTGTLTFSLASGTLPAGLTLSSSGTLSGTPTAGGSSTFTIKVTDASSAGAVTATSGNVTLNVSSTLPSITTTTLPAATVGTAYSQTIAYSAGTYTGTPTFAVTAGASALTAAGLSLNTSTGVLSGTPTAAGPIPFSVTVTIGGGTSAAQALSLTVNLPPPPTVTTTSLPNATVGASYSQQLACNNCNSNSGATWAATPASGAGSLASVGLSLNTSTGVISGTPTTTGTVSVTVTVSYGGQTSTGVLLGLIVNLPPPPTVTTTSLPNATVGASYSQQLSCNNCNSNSGATWAATPASGTNSLASVGLSLNTSTGIISGTPTVTGTVSITVTVSYGGQTSTGVLLGFLVSNAAPISINTQNSNTLTGEIGLPFGAVFTASGGVPPYTWSISSGTPPAGINSTISTSTVFDSHGAGVLSGTPTGSASSGTSITVKVTDHNNTTATQNFTININANTNRTGSNGELSGQYAFLVSGFDSTGTPVARIGSFTANGSGAITGGVFDVNSATNTTALTPTTITGGSYSIGANGSGVLTYTVSGGSVTYIMAVDKITSGVAVSGYLTRWDSSGNSVTGRFQQQTPSTFNNAGLTGSYAFGLGGFSSNSTAASLRHTGVIGVFKFDGAGNINTSGSELMAYGAGNTPFSPTSGTYSITGTNGRGLLTFGINGGGGPQTINVLLYMIDGTKAFMMSGDPGATNDLLSGQAAIQSGAPYTTASLSGASIFHSTGLVTSGSTFSSVTSLGTATWTSGAVAFSLDTNSGGTADGVASGGSGPWNPIATAGTYTVASNGRVTLSGGTLGSNPSYFYLSGPNTGFSLDFSSSANTGGLDSQTATTLSGSFSGGTIDPAGQNASYQAFEITATLGTSPNGTISTGSADANQFGFLTPDQNLSGATYTGSATGRTVITGGGGSHAPTILYVVSANKAYVTSLSDGSPVLIEFTHQ